MYCFGWQKIDHEVQAAYDMLGYDSLLLMVGKLS